MRLLSIVALAGIAATAFAEPSPFAIKIRRDGATVELRRRPGYRTVTLYRQNGSTVRRTRFLDAERRTASMTEEHTAPSGNRRQVYFKGGGKQRYTDMVERTRPDGDTIVDFRRFDRQGQVTYSEREVTARGDDFSRVFVAGDQRNVQRFRMRAGMDIGDMSRKLLGRLTTTPIETTFQGSRVLFTRVAMPPTVAALDGVAVRRVGDAICDMRALAMATGRPQIARLRAGPWRRAVEWVRTGAPARDVSVLVWPPVDGQN